MSERSGPGAVRGTALSVAAAVGPGIPTLPTLAAAQAGPASPRTVHARADRRADRARRSGGDRFGPPPRPGQPRAVRARGSRAGRLVRARAHLGAGRAGGGHLGLAAGVKLLPRFTRSWWAAVVATAAVPLLLIPAGAYVVTPGLIATALGCRALLLRARGGRGPRGGRRAPAETVLTPAVRQGVPHLP